MKKLLLVLGLCLAPVRAHAAASALAVDLQPVIVSSALPAGNNEIGKVGISSGANSLNVNADGSINVDVTNQMSVSGSTMQVTGLGGGPVQVQQVGSMSVISGTGTFNTTGSTVGIQGSQGQVIASSNTAGGVALKVVNVGLPSLDGRTPVYSSSNNFVTGGVINFSGLVKSIDLMALNGTCTFQINSGDLIIVSKNTDESYDFAYTLANPSITLTAKDNSGTCKSRIVGAQ